MKKIKDFLIKNFKMQDNIILVFAGVLLTGVLLGSICYNIFSDKLSLSLKAMLENYVTYYNFADINNLFFVFLRESSILLLAFIFGYTIIGVPFLFLIILFKGFCFGISISTFILTFGFEGIFIGACTFAIQNIIYIIADCLMIFISLKSSISVASYYRGSSHILKPDRSFLNNFKGYLFLNIFIIFGSIFEGIVNPVLLNIIL